MAKRTARAFWVEGPLRGALREELLPPVGPAQVLVEAKYSGVSRGSESLVWQGLVPRTEHTRMRCPHQAGEFPFPVKYGYSSVGRVVQGPAELVGRSVFALYPHQSAYVVDVGAVLVLPSNVPEARAVLGANMETALNALWDARPLIGDRVTVIGAGVVGSLAAYLASRLLAVDVELVDVRSERAELAQALGVRFALPEHAAHERDLVFHASASQSGLELGLGILAAEGTLFELSWYGENGVSLGLGGSFHSGRLSLRASQVGRVSPRARPRFGYRERLSLALELLADERLDVLIDGESSLDELPRLLNELGRSERGRLCHRIHYG